MNSKEEYIFFEGCKKLGLTKSALLKKALFDYLNRQDTCKGEMKRILLRQIAKQQITEYNSSMYAIKNCQTTIYNLGVASLINTGNLNYPMLNGAIDGYLKLVKTFNKTEQEILKQDIQGLQALQNPVVLKAKFDTIQRIEFSKKRRGK